MCTPNISIYVGMMSGTSMDGVDAVACVLMKRLSIYCPQF